MTNYSVKTVAEFIKAAPAVARPHLKEMQAAVRAAAPKAAELIGYGKPYYKTTRWLVGFDVYTHHINFEIWEGQLAKEVREALEKKGYKTGSKTFRVRYDQPVPVAMIKKITKEAAKAAAAKN